MIIDMEKIPLPDIPSATGAQTIDCGAGVYMKVIQEISKEEYHTYLELLKTAGYEEYTRGEEEVRYRIRTAAFRKEQQIVTVTYNGYWNRIYITSYLNKEETKPNLSIEEGAQDYGAGNYVKIVDDVTLDYYREYQKRMETLGFAKHIDNGNGLFGRVFSSIYTKENMVLTITYVAKISKMYISTCEGLPLSKHLFCNDDAIRNQMEDKKVSLHMLQMEQFGNSFLFKLKNGHFMISDGGLDADFEHLLEYIESHTRVGEKPIIDAWFISHGHPDHCGVFRRIVEEQEYANRICVEGIYYNEPNDNAVNLDPVTRVSIIYMKEAAKILRTSDGKTTQIYRPQTGQRYYFDDITVDIVLGQEQLPLRDWTGDFNDSSTWCLFTIEGQRCLFGGDGDKGGICFILEAYEPEDMQLDIMTLLHHGHNTRDIFTEFCSVQTVLVTNGKDLPEHRAQENEHLKETSKEWISWKEGTIIMEFPYRLGTYKTINKNVRGGSNDAQ